MTCFSSRMVACWPTRQPAKTSKTGTAAERRLFIARKLTNRRIRRGPVKREVRETGDLPVTLQRLLARFDPVGGGIERRGEFLPRIHVRKCDHPGKIGVVGADRRGPEQHRLCPRSGEKLDLGFRETLLQRPQSLQRPRLIDAHFENPRCFWLGVKRREIRRE